MPSNVSFFLSICICLYVCGFFYVWLCLCSWFFFFLQSRILISSYETFRAHVHRLQGVPIDMVVCDEAHRLKNDKTKTALAISELPAKKRLLLSGTPIQNDLDEFFALVSLCNPAVVGKSKQERNLFLSFFVSILKRPSSQHVSPVSHPGGPSRSTPKLSLLSL